ncbi:MAG: N-acetyl-gamma-glutamyl-phosphate reductase, partial [Gemmatimonadetes bacterium]|nr:N-acetyl-gamma-glutamyl-phosphate reductase [Gemmatimonadota bacterium]NIR80550.1 N-acetyl-gamma-glutamyl-phosphate reductase [Gemmatimonadota bacterium]NIT89315.1 N-acetyl-gamma-glutamyl-phosphate reductase [Gemmatimonadota bacterium]NIU33120.1 N-acetyl-gamma-glutamyl-phosphate reductase [Gemmatimonadota bacterium]NIU37485.1 N-acetyl-gamma-glutamyl-phosphate reductase [Gemmatimonadota bacterium]
MSPNNYATPRVGVLGGSGYTGRELLRILRDHGGVEVAFATARSEAGDATELPGLAYAPPDGVDPGSVDLLFLCLPHGEAAPRVEELRGADVRIVDLTGDHRPGSGREEGAVYGLPELHGPELPDARLVANPGCYPTGVILALAPLCREGLVDPGRPVIVNAASGVTGAGRSPRRDLLFGEVAGDFRAYAVGNRHRHLGEMRAPFPGLRLLFTPHLLPVSRGILETICLPLRGDADAGAVRD